MTMIVSTMEDVKLRRATERQAALKAICVEVQELSWKGTAVPCDASGGAAIEEDT